jgi:drug/metabolite transporter (DMT)-like permease
MIFFWDVIASTCISIGLKLFTRFKVNTFNAIVINYTVCLALGTMLDPEVSVPFSKEIVSTPWFAYDILLGVLFIFGFNLNAHAIQTAGITLTSLMQRMSLVLTVTFAVIFFKEHFGPIEITGISLAILAIIAINQKGKKFNLSGSTPFPWVLFAVLLIASVVEILLFYAEKTNIVGESQLAFTTHAFGCAAIFGWISIGWLWFRKKLKITSRDLIGGILLGIPNFFSIYLLMVMLNQGWNGSILYPMINVSVLLLSTLIAVIAFREKLSRINWIGIVLATGAILFIAYAHSLNL